MKKKFLLLSATMVFVLALGGIAAAFSWAPETNVTQATVNQYLGDVSSDYIVWEDDDFREIFVYDFDNPLIGGTNISNNGASMESEDPRISGNFVTWETYDDNFGTTDIYVYDLSTPAVPAVKITDGGGDIRFENPRVSGSYVVFASHWHTANWGNCTEDVYYYNVATPGVPPVAITDNEDDSSDYGDTYCNPEISGHHIVWEYEFNDGDDADIYFYDIDDPTFGGTPLTDGEGSYYSQDPAIDGDIVAWEHEDWSTYYDDIYMYDLGAVAQPVGGTDISQVAGNQYTRNPEVSDGKIVFEFTDDDTDLDNIFLYDTEAASPGLVNLTNNTDTNLDPRRPKIDGDFVVWRTSDDNANRDWVTLGQISTGAVSNITTDATDDWNPLIAGNRIAWESWRNLVDGNYDIMTTTVSAGPSFVALPEGGQPINITEGQVITTNPFIIKVKPVDIAGVDYVQCWIDGILVGNFIGPDADGVYSFSWDTSLYQSFVQVVAYNMDGVSTEINRNTTVALELPYTGI